MLGAAFPSLNFAGHTMEGSGSGLAWLLVHTAAASAFGGVVEAHEFAMVKLPNAKCLDGTPAVYYVAANASSPSWVVWLEGGGICLNLADCAQRAKGRLGSSAAYPDSIAAPKGMLSSDAAANPDLHTWNRVFVPYCSGDVWTGTKRDASNPFPQAGAWRGFFHGHLILEDMYEDISQRYLVHYIVHYMVHYMVHCIVHCTVHDKVQYIVQYTVQYTIPLCDAGTKTSVSATWRRRRRRRQC